ncbi:hypothetical protein [Desulfovibrio sp. UCD-KL4C]|uniref:hypothetical protein n=1 Tax=Desulfovibrio sp. UCD-KL4C TaxID=2578120 RepID=UPI0025B87594|nr:hypothetical protein [Desulfovibrio sp. UCD-KL4C]
MMTQNQTDEESKLISIPEIEKAIKSFEKELEACKERIQKLLKSENPAKGIYFAQEIFESKRDKLRLEVEITSRKNKINRIKLGTTEL